jgi:FMN phosphatase YigB (HAD superfamily)
MVGDDWNNDVVPATQLGIATYWIAPQQPVPPKTDLIVGSGTLEDFYIWLQQQCEDRE